VAYAGLLLGGANDRDIAGPEKDLEWRPAADDEG